jgi:hypothetical protein
MLAWLQKHQQRFDNNTKSVLKFIFSFDLNEIIVNLIIQYLITSPL